MHRTVAIRDLRGPADRAGYLAVRAAAWPWWAQTDEELAALERADETFQTLVAWRDGAVVGGASLGRVFTRDVPDDAWVDVFVAPAAQRQGVGTELFRAVTSRVLARGQHAARGVARAGSPAAAFATRLGAREIDRAKAVEVVTRVAAALPIASPPGVELVTLAARPDLLAELYAVDGDTVLDIPSAEPHRLPPFAEWVELELTGLGVTPDAVFIAVVDGQVAGYCSLGRSPARPGVAEHAYTGVRPAFRRRGIALALKLAAIRYAAATGIERLVAENDEANAPMRAINARLGYAPVADVLVVRVLL